MVNLVERVLLALQLTVSWKLCELRQCFLCGSPVYCTILELKRQNILMMTNL